MGRNSSVSDQSNFYLKIFIEIPHTTKPPMSFWSLKKYFIFVLMLKYFCSEKYENIVYSKISKVRKIILKSLLINIHLKKIKCSVQTPLNPTRSAITISVRKSLTKMLQSTPLPDRVTSLTLLKKASYRSSTSQFGTSHQI